MVRAGGDVTYGTVRRMNQKQPGTQGVSNFWKEEGQCFFFNLNFVL